MKTAFITIFVVAFLAASSTTGIYLTSSMATKPTPRVYLPYVHNPGVFSLLIRGYVSDYTTPSGSPPTLPNLRPYAPANWAYPVVPSSSPGRLQISPLIAGPSNYFNWAVLNEGNSMVSGRAYTCLYLDGNEIGRWYSDNQPKRSYAFVNDWKYPVLSGGSHTVKLQADCTGVVAEANESDNLWQMSFSWQLPVIVSGQQGIDTCSAPSLNQMRAWWLHSPYYDTNIYIGGVSRGCPQPNLTAAWVQNVTGMGWRLIPTWVGPQAPCSSLRNKISSDPSTAYSQGRSEADLASSTAGQLGLIDANQPGTVIYYDMEYFDYTNAGCLQAAQSFIGGWVDRLHELGSRAGMYSTSSILSFFWSLPNPPDDIWAAQWKTPYTYNPSATVWNLTAISNTWWANHQRIRQYTGSHNETWGGITLNIDSDVLDAHVAGSIPDPSAGGSAAQSIATAAVGPQVLGMDLITAEDGWVLLGDSLLWTSDSGDSWQDIGPSLGQGEQLSAAYFLSSQAGWVATTNPADPSGETAWRIYRTEDRGAHWIPSALPISAAQDGSWANQSFLHFVGPQNGWLVLQQTSSSSFRPGRLFRTEDGGLTWEETSIPIGEPVMFFTPDIGYTAGGPAGDELYRTQDGGRSWEPQAAALGLTPREVPQYSLPIPQGGTNALLSVIIPSEDNPRIESYVTQDNGKNWVLQSSQPWSTDSTAPTWKTSEPGALSAQVAISGTLPAGTYLVDFADSLSGWAVSSNGSCQGQKGIEPLQCTLQNQIWITRDGGLSWMEAASQAK